MAIPKYGMKFRTIRYFQNQGRELNSMTGWNPVRDHRILDITRSSRHIAHDVIAVSGVVKPEEMRAFLVREVQ